MPMSGKPQVAYRETISKTVQETVKYVKQTGGHGQYAHVVISAEPLEPASGFEFVNKIVGGVNTKGIHPCSKEGD